MVWLTIVYLVGSCASDTQDDYSVSRTVLIYVAADNSLSGYASENFEQILKGYAQVNGFRANLLVYIDLKGDHPHLYQIYKEKGKVRKRIIQNYPERNSSSKDVMADVFRNVYEHFPASSYGLVLAFHGAGWLPENDYLTSSDSKTKRSEFPTRQPELSGESYMDVTVLSKALNDVPFLDFIVFDACLMGSAEVACELNGRAGIMIASPTEVHAQGFPYDLLVKSLFAAGTPDYQLICDDYIHSYLNKETDDERSRTATMAVYNLKYIDDLRTFVQTVSQKYKNEYDDVNPLKVQPFDRLTHKVFFDAKDLMLQLPLTSNEKEQLNSILSNLVICKFATPYFINLPIDKFCGISLGYQKYQMKDLQNRYTVLNWNKKTG